MRCSQRQGFFAVCDVALFVNNGAENIGCSLNRDRLPVRLLLLLLAVVMDDFDTLLSGSTLCLAYAKFPVFYFFLSCLHISQCRSISFKGAVCPAVSRSDPG
ncbi:hypothetical protein ARMGADRAFT_827963 [Armillaria gallica]|uniref:Uncharacterized protein n=1 Tax=Armillaria gallica TaxID=47427 RepID=A0A2H3CFN8_ARMGA|nr:hypothetical protein ARMGADRAFT_827963 [Armillaria gallica]